jgi:ABC-type antimicrobial peptide transport system permease subunit
VKSYDPIILGLSATVLVAFALIAASVPACRAASADPLVALRYE